MSQGWQQLVLTLTTGSNLKRKEEEREGKRKWTDLGVRSQGERARLGQDQIREGGR